MEIASSACVSGTPFGRPVVPDVYASSAVSPGRGRGARSGPPARAAPRSRTPTTGSIRPSRSAGPGSANASLAPESDTRCRNSAPVPAGLARPTPPPPKRRAQAPERGPARDQTPAAGLAPPREPARPPVGVGAQPPVGQALAVDGHREPAARPPGRRRGQPGDGLGTEALDKRAGIGHVRQVRPPARPAPLLAEAHPVLQPAAVAHPGPRRSSVATPSITPTPRRCLPPTPGRSSDPRRPGSPPLRAQPVEQPAGRRDRLDLRA